MRSPVTVLLAFALLFLSDWLSSAAAQEHDEDVLEDEDSPGVSQDQDESEEDDSLEASHADESEEDDSLEAPQDEEGEADGESKEEGAPDAPFEGPPGHHEDIAHPLAMACIQGVEGIEKEIGFFDDETHNNDARKSIAKKMAGHARELLLSGGKEAKADFEDKFHVRLQSVQGGFGASDACQFLLRHHGELEEVDSSEFSQDEEETEEEDPSEASEDDDESEEEDFPEVSEDEDEIEQEDSPEASQEEDGIQEGDSTGSSKDEL